MKYVSREPTGIFDLNKYGDYLEQNRGALVGHVQGAELLTIDRFLPTGPRSFHDARFESLLVTSALSGCAGPEAQTIRVELRLKGPYFDRFFELHYKDVNSCSFQAPAPADDLLMHEISEEHGVLTHELQFDKGKTIVVTCRELRFLETLETDRVANES